MAIEKVYLGVNFFKNFPGGQAPGPPAGGVPPSATTPPRGVASAVYDADLGPQFLLQIYALGRPMLHPANKQYLQAQGC